MGLIDKNRKNFVKIMQLYPLKFDAILKSTIWGGERIASLKGIASTSSTVGESWEVADVKNDKSTVSNGPLRGRTLSQLLTAYKEELVGKSVYDRFADHFPLLIKYIDAHDNLSIQVHPDDETAKARHNSLGKTEMWYVVDAEPGAELIMGFEGERTKEEYLAKVADGTLDSILRKVPVEKGDVFFIPSGTVHAIGKGIVIAEIQESSDITYRIFDYNRKDKNGNGRQLHTDLAMDVVDFKACNLSKTPYEATVNGITPVVQCPYFTTSVIELQGGTLTCDYSQTDSFVIYMCLEGDVTLKCDGEAAERMVKGETMLLPAAIKNVCLEGTGRLLEIHI